MTNIPIEQTRKNEDNVTEHQCPQCKRWYIPTYEVKAQAPEGTIGREQHMTGICSDKCWDALFPPEFKE